MSLGGNLVELFFFCSPEAFVGFVLLLEKVAKFTLAEMEIKRELCLTETDHDFVLDSIDVELGCLNELICCFGLSLAHLGTLVELSWLVGAKSYHNG